MLAGVLTALIVVSLTSPVHGAEDPHLSSVRLTATETRLPLDGTSPIEVRGTMSDGSAADLQDAEVSVTSSDVQVATAAMDGTSGLLRAGTMKPGTTTLEASVSLDGETATDGLDVRVEPKPARPFRHDYHQTLTMKMFMADNQGRVSRTFEQALDTIETVDNLTRGVPKIFYLVGWQYDGHDTGYPAWDVVNPKLKRPEDETALQSLRWLIREARRYDTTVSFHINMLDASKESPLWDTYLDADVIARNDDGSLREYVWGHPISYTREWNAGLTKQRIDTLFEMVDMAQIGTVHVDALHQYIPGYGTEPISPYHDVTTDQEIATQKKILRYWRDRGVDVTSEFAYSYRKDPLLGLQPMSWHFRDVDPMEIPPTLHIGGAGGDERFGTSMQGESIIKGDPERLEGFLDEFATTTLPWYYLNRLERLSDSAGVVRFSEGVTSQYVDGALLTRQGDVTLRDGDDVFVPALWQEQHHREIIAYSRAGYGARTWRLPDAWDDVRAVDIYRIGLDGLTRIARKHRVRDDAVELSLPAGAAVSIVPHQTDVGDAVTSSPHMFDALSPGDGASGVSPDATRFQWEDARNADRYRLIVAEDAEFGSVVVDITTRSTARVLRSLHPGTRYFWKVEAIGGPGGGSIAVNGAPLDFRTAYTDVPAQPTGVHAYRTSDEEVFVTWDRTPGAASYTVERRPLGADSFTTVTESLTSTSHLDAATRGDASYEYRVTAINDLGAGEPSASVAEQDLDTSDARYVSDLDWVSATVGWGDIGRDRSVSGGDIRLDGTRYAKGLGVHAQSEVIYRLAEEDRLFRAIVGIDDAKRESPASVRFRVLGDGEVLYDSGVMHAEPYTPPRRVLVDVSGHDRMTLQVTDGGDGINSDHANWADAQLVPVSQ